MAIRKIISRSISDGTVAAAKIPDDAITGGKLANNIAISTTGAITTTGAFTSQGIDDNADATAITIDSSEHIGIGGSPNNFGGMTRSVEIKGTADVELSLHATSDSMSDGDRIGQIAFNAGSDSTVPTVAAIRGVVSGTDENKGEIAFHTRNTDTGGLPTERMRICSTSGKFIFNSVRTYYFYGSVTGQGTATLDVTGLQSVGVSLVTAQYTHHNINNYGALRISSVATYGGSIVNAVDIQNVSSANNGSWSITTPSSGTLRITKTAGNYVGGGYYWVKVETYLG
tara:strand:- start:537 stop:1391 length:855 start_codon:yes stop_codon:yes gene_type:complete